MLFLLNMIIGSKTAMISIENQKQGLTAKPFKIGSGFPIATSNLLENGNNIRPNNEV